MKPLRIAFLGYGYVMQAFMGLVADKYALLQAEYGVNIQVVGIATRSRGIAIVPEGFPLRPLSDFSNFHVGQPVMDMFEFIERVPADIIIEATTVNPQTGQPATDYCRAALKAGKHVVTPNKGPVAFALPELQHLAAERGLGFFYESTVMDGAPIHSLKRESLLAAQVQNIRGILNSTTNSILSRMGEGVSFEAALQEMQAKGTAEADPSNDIDGWDASIKLAILANTYLGADLRPTDIDRTGIRVVTAEDIHTAQAENLRLKLICEAGRDEQGKIWAKVAPQMIPLSDPLAWLDGASSGLTIQTDVLGTLAVTKSPSSPRSTAYGVLVDCLNIARGRR